MNTQLSTKVKDWIQSDLVKSQVTQALPDPNQNHRFFRCLFTQVQKIPKLLECDQKSLLSAMIGCAQLGIEPDGRRAHLIPYGNQCQLIIDYKGLVELVMQSGDVANIHADKVCENDDFDYNAGRIEKHRIDFKKPRGSVYAYYCVVRFKDGSEKAEVMSLDEVTAIKNRSKSGNSGPWKTDLDEMGKKTVARRTFKWIPLSPIVRDALERDDDKLDESGMKKAEHVFDLAAEEEQPEKPEKPEKK